MEKNEEIRLLATEINELLSNYYCPVSDQMLEQEKNLINTLPLLTPIHHQSYHLLNLNNSMFTSINSVHENKLLKPGIYAHQPLNSDELI